jgi:hypothetical protein
MADAPTVTTPDYTGIVNQQFFLRPLGGPTNPLNYLDRFPEEVYTKSIDSHLVRFMYALLGPAGIGWLRKNYLEARLKLEDFNIETFDLDKFYGDPLKFGRILEEVYDVDPGGLIPRDQWEEIRAKDAQYRNRAIDFVNGARAGNTPLGMRLVARSGLGHEVEIVENYKYIYDQLSDDPIGLQKYGFSKSTNEFIVIPRRELPQNEIQTVTISGQPTGGTFALFFPVGNEATNTTQAIAYNADRNIIKAFLESIPAIGPNNVIVSGGPLPNVPIEILFTGDLGYNDVPQLQAIPALTGGTLPTILVETQRSGVSQTDEVVSISPRDQRYLWEALERVKPVATIATYGQGSGTTSSQIFNSVFSTSSYQEVIRYVTGQNGILWPALSSTSWIEKSVEHHAPRGYGDLQQHYQGFHNVAGIIAYDDQAVADLGGNPNYTDLAQPQYNNSHIGEFSGHQRTLYPVLNQVLPSDFQFDSDRALADYAEPLVITSSTTGDGAVQLVNGIYPTSYQSLAGVPEIKYRDEQFWASVERPTGTDYIEIDFGSPQAVNYLYFEITGKPYDIAVEYDLLDQAPDRAWQPVTLTPDLPSISSIGYQRSVSNPWQKSEIWFQNSLGKTIYTRYLRIRFDRRQDLYSPFVDIDGTLLPYSIEVRNLRVARNVG